MPAQSEATTKYGKETAEEYGYGPFSQLIANLGAIPSPGAIVSPGEINSLVDRILSQKGIINLGADPANWINKLVSPTVPREGMSLWHGLGDTSESLFKSILQRGLQSGWFAREPAEFWGPAYARAKFADLPQPVFMQRHLVEVDPSMEYAPPPLYTLRQARYMEYRGG